MGDSGSMFLGYVLATTSILGASIKSSTAVAILVPLIALGLPIIDTLFAMSRRFLERRPIFSPDRGHIHHRLLAMGINHRRAVLILYGTSILLACSAILIALGRDFQVGGMLLLLSMAAIGLVRGMGNLQSTLRRWRRRERMRSPAVERLRRSVPRYVAQIGDAPEAQEVGVLLLSFAQTSELSAITCDGVAHSGLGELTWQSDGKQTRRDGEEVCASYRLGALGEGARLNFHWQSDQGDVSPEAEILLQLIADAVESRMTRADTSSPEAFHSPADAHSRAG